MSVKLRHVLQWREACGRESPYSDQHPMKEEIGVRYRKGLGGGGAGTDPGRG